MIVIKNLLLKPKHLGWLGAIPFLVSAILVIIDNDYKFEIRIIGLLYASTILSFLGAVHWGYLLKSEKLESYLWFWSVFTPLLSWVALIIIVFHKNYYISSILLSLGFFSSYIIDNKIFLFHRWYLSLRARLSIIAISCTLINGIL